MPTLDIWFDYSCPYAYLASTQVEALAQRACAELRWQPMLLGGVFAALDVPQNLAGTLSPAKARHNFEDMMRWAELFGVTLTMPSTHPMRTVEALRATIATGCNPRVIHGFYRAYWVHGEPPSKPSTIERVLHEADLDPAPVLARLGDASLKEELRARTDRALSLGVFGAPALVVDAEDGRAPQLFWGQDRLAFVERALAGWRAAGT